MRHSHIACVALALVILGGAAMAAATWMPEYEISSRRVNTEGRIAGRRVAPKVNFKGTLPDLEQSLRSKRLPAKIDKLRGRRISIESRVGRRVAVRENFVSTRPDLELEIRSRRRPAKTDKLVGRRVVPHRKLKAQFPTPESD